MRHGGGIRIDHILGLFRTFWIPNGGTPFTGGYVRSHAEELLAVLAIESARAGTFVVGEDLGTVEEGVRESLAANGVLGTRLVYFEDDLPATWPSGVLGAATTHDLPTIAGVWTGADERLRTEAGLTTEGNDRLRSAIARVAGEGADTTAAITAVHRALAASPVEIAMATLEDVLAVEERPNMPGTIDEWPNWSISLPDPIDDLVEGAAPATLQAIADRDGD